MNFANGPLIVYLLTEFHMPSYNGSTIITNRNY